MNSKLKLFIDSFSDREAIFNFIEILDEVSFPFTIIVPYRKVLSTLSYELERPVKIIFYSNTSYKEVKLLTERLYPVFHSVFKKGDFFYISQCKNFIINFIKNTLSIQRVVFKEVK